MQITKKTIKNYFQLKVYFSIYQAKPTVTSTTTSDQAECVETGNNTAIAGNKRKANSPLTSSSENEGDLGEAMVVSSIENSASESMESSKGTNSKRGEYSIRKGRIK